LGRLGDSGGVDYLLEIVTYGRSGYGAVVGMGEKKLRIAVQPSREPESKIMALARKTELTQSAARFNHLEAPLNLSAS
jgi:hypothetical protein